MRFFVVPMKTRSAARGLHTRKSIQETDLLRLVDTMIFAEQLKKLTPQELKEARETSMYKMLMRMGREAYRAGEKGLRPRPTLTLLRDETPDEKEQEGTTPADIDVMHEGADDEANRNSVVGIDDGQVEQGSGAGHASNSGA